MHENELSRIQHTLNNELKPTKLIEVAVWLIESAIEKMENETALSSQVRLLREANKYTAETLLSWPRG